MTKQTEALKLALEALAQWETGCGTTEYLAKVENAVPFIREALAEHPAQRKPLTDEQKDAARWRWLSWHIKVAWNEGKFTSLVRIVSDKDREALNASIDRMMAGDWSDAEAAHGITKE